MSEWASCTSSGTSRSGAPTTPTPGGGRTAATAPTPTTCTSPCRGPAPGPRPASGRAPWSPGSRAMRHRRSHTVPGRRRPRPRRRRRLHDGDGRRHPRRRRGGRRRRLLLQPPRRRRRSPSQARADAEETLGSGDVPAARVAPRRKDRRPSALQTLVSMHEARAPVRSAQMRKVVHAGLASNIASSVLSPVVRVDEDERGGHGSVDSLATI